MKKPKIKLSPKILAIKKQYDSCCAILFAAFLIGLGVSMILDWPTAAILSANSLLKGNIMSLIEGVVGIVVAMVSVFVLSILNGYYRNKFQFKQLLLAIALVFATQTVLAILLGHSVWFSGPSVFLSTYAFKTVHFDAIGQMGAKQIIANYDWLFTTLTFWLLYAPLLLLGKYLGAKKSKKDFAKERAEKAKGKTLNEHPFD